MVMSLCAFLVLGTTSCSNGGAGSRPERVSVTNAGHVQLLETLTIPGYAKGAISQSSIAFSPDGRFLVGASGVNRVPIWEVQSGTVQHLLYDGTQQIVACAFSPDGKSVACGGFDRKVTLWSVETGLKIRDLGSTDSPVWELDFSLDGKKLVSCSVLDDIRLWDVDRGTMLWSYGGTGGFLSVSIDQSGKRIAYGGRWGGAGTLDAASGRLILALNGPQKPVGDATYNPLGDVVAAGADDDTIYLWEAEVSQPLAFLKGHTDYVNGVAFSPDGVLLASGSHDRTVGIWDVAGHTRLATLEGHQDVVLRVAFSPDGTKMASISWDGTVRLWGVP